MNADNPGGTELPATPYLVSAPSTGASPSRPRLPALIGTARNLLTGALCEAFPSKTPAPRLLLGVSGGADSLALAVIASHFHRTSALNLGAVVVDHQLQTGSAEVAQRTAQVLRGLGLTQVDIKTADSFGQPAGQKLGPEAAARSVRYAAFAESIQEHGVKALLLAHTMNDSAEQVLLGLARGSGTRSLAGIRPQRLFTEAGGDALLLRPFLTLSREQTVQICELAGVLPWQDPSNTDLAFARNRVRQVVLPELDAQLGPKLIGSLARSAQLLRQDADALDQLAEAEFRRIAISSPAQPAQVSLDTAALRALPTALGTRVLRLAVVSLGAPAPTLERVEALAALTERHGSAGPVQLPGHVSAYRQNRAQRLAESRAGASCGNIVLRIDSSPATEESIGGFP